MKIILNENQKKGIVDRIKNMIDDLGLIQAIKSLGGFKVFDKLMTGYFNSNRNKIQFIEDAVRKEEAYGSRLLHLHEFGFDILYGEEEENGITYKSYIEQIGLSNAGLSNDEGYAVIVIWEYDEDGNAYDEYTDLYDVWLDRISPKYIKQIFDMIFNYYIETGEL